MQPPKGLPLVAAPTPDEMLHGYRRPLDQFGLDCNHHVYTLAEDFYPIDLAEEALPILDVVAPSTEALTHTLPDGYSREFQTTDFGYFWTPFSFGRMAIF